MRWEFCEIGHAALGKYPNVDIRMSSQASDRIRRHIKFLFWIYHAGFVLTLDTPFDMEFLLKFGLRKQLIGK